MPDGPSFKIASGFVEVTAKVDKNAVRRSADEAADLWAGSFRQGGDRAGEEFTDHATSRVRGSRGRFLSAADAAVSGIETAVGNAGRRAGEGFSRDVTVRLRDDRGRFRRAGLDLGDETSRGMRTGLFAGVSRFGDGLGRTLQSASRAGIERLKGDFKRIGEMFPAGGAIVQWLLKPIMAITALGTSLQTIPPAIFAIAGGLAALPALATAAAASIATIGLGSLGIGDAIGEVFNPPARGGGGGGGGGADTGARDRVAAAERRLAAAQRESKSAQEALTDARRAARRELRDMSIALAGARLDEKSAMLAVSEAERDLANVTRDRKADDIDRARAQLSLEQAQQALLETQTRLKDMTEDQARASKAGVEGSEQVKSALERQRNAVDSVADAQSSLKQAQQSATTSAVGGGAATVRAYDKLTASAKKFVDVFVKYKDELKGLQSLAQERIFKGLDGHLDHFIKNWLPEARKGIRTFGDDWNTTIAKTMDAFSTPKFIGAVDKVLGVADRLWDKFNKRIPDIANSFADLLDGASPFIEKVGEHLLGMLDDFTGWIKTNKKDGDLKKFFSEAADQANALLDIGKELATIIGQVVDIAMGQQKEGKKSGLESMADSLKGVSEWLDTKQGRESVREWIDALKDFAHAVLDVVAMVNTLKKAWNDFEADRQANRKKVKIWALEIELTFLGAYRRVLDAGIAAFGWIPGLGDRLRNAKKTVDKFVADANRSLGNLRDKTIYVKIKTQGNLDHVHTENGGGRERIDKRYGGIVQAANGLVTGASAGIFTAPTILFGERGTARGGGSKEAFIPENIPRSRALGILAEPARWNNATVVPNEAMGGGGGLAGSTVYVAVTMDFPTGPVTQIVRGVITDNPRDISVAAEEGKRRRAWVSPQRAGR